jgi:ribosomal protein L21E
MREKRNHCTSKMLQEFRNLGNMVTIHFEPLRPHKKTVDENFYVTSG